MCACAWNVMCVCLCMYVLEHCKRAGLRSRWWFCHNEIETRPPSSPPPLHISSWDGWFYSWMIAAALALWWGDLFDVKSFVKGQYLRWLQLSRLVFACHKASSIFANCQYLPQSFEVISLSQKSNQINLARKVKFESIWLENINKCLVRIIKLGG